MAKDTGEWVWRAGKTVWGFDPSSEIYRDGACMVELNVNADGSVTVTHVQNWRHDEKAKPFQTIYRAGRDIGLLADAVRNSIGVSPALPLTGVDD